MGLNKDPDIPIDILIFWSEINGLVASFRCFKVHRLHIFVPYVNISQLSSNVANVGAGGFQGAAGHHERLEYQP